jgi:hypothetical protein
MAFPFALLEHFRNSAAAGSENVESREFAALARVASKGVYAGGGPIAEGAKGRKTCVKSGYTGRSGIFLVLDVSRER